VLELDVGPSVGLSEVLEDGDELTHLQSGSISVQAQSFDSIVVCSFSPFTVIDLEYEH